MISHNEVAQFCEMMASISTTDILHFRNYITLIAAIKSHMVIVDIQMLTITGYRYSHSVTVSYGPIDQLFGERKKNLQVHKLTNITSR